MMFLARVAFALALLIGSAHAQMGSFFPGPGNSVASPAPFALDGTPVLGTSSGSASSLQVGSAITTTFANTLLLVPIVTNSAGVTGVSDGTNTYARVTGLTPATASSTVDCWFAIAATPGSYQPTVTTSGAAFLTIGVIGVSGTKTSSIFETPTSTNTGTNATFTTVNANTFMLGVDVNVGTAVVNSFTNDIVANFMVVDHKFDTAARTGYVYDASNGSSSIAVAAIKGP